MADKIEMQVLGYFRSNQVAPYEAGRQPDAFHSSGYVELLRGHNYEQALIGLEECEYIWILFQFHHNSHWNPMVLPPRGRDTKIGVFATRSPYRPNGIGMSCVRIEKIENLKIYVAGADLLEGSPILDIKPYVAYADSVPEAEPLWLKEAVAHDVNFSLEVLPKMQWLEEKGLTQLRGFIWHQLEYEPTNHKKKRVRKSSLFEHSFELSYRTWRILFSIDGIKIVILDLKSGYSEEELQKTEDPYKDKEIHRQFLGTFS